MFFMKIEARKIYERIIKGFSSIIGPRLQYNEICFLQTYVKVNYSFSKINTYKSMPKKAHVATNSFGQLFHFLS